MKKILVAILAVSTMVLGFTSCEKSADPAKEPIAGKTFRMTDPGESGDFIQFAFHTNYRVTNTIRSNGNTTIQDALVWKMKANAKDFDIRWAAGAYNTQTGQAVGGMVVYEGVYDAATKTVIVTLQGTQELIQYECPEVQ